MPYFANGTDGMDWQARNCERGCVHNAEEAPGCPILSVSFEFNYDQCAGKTFRDDVKARAAGIHAVLEALVPTGEDGFAADCPFRQEPK